MSNAATTSLARQLGALYSGGSAAGLSDRQLLERIGARGEPPDEAAFAAVVARHGPMVLSVCRQLLGDYHHAEDAFQAVFLVLARRARSIRDPDLLAAWLHGVALRTARKTRGRLARRRQVEEAAAVGRAEGRSEARDRPSIDREQAEALHGEIARLPEPFRLAVVSCYLEGLSPDEAARRLRWPSGTLRSRLVRARERLRRGLMGRGIALATTAITEARSVRSAEASVSPLLCDSSTRAAIAFAARQSAGGAFSAPAAVMAREVLKTMLWHKLKAAALPLLMLAALAAGAAYDTLGALAPPREGEPPGEPDARKARQEPRPPDSPRTSPARREPRPADSPGIHPAPGRMLVTGRVLDPAGKPVAGATTMVFASLKWPGRGDRLAEMAPSSLGRARSDAAGQFHLDAPRVSSGRHERVGIVATAPGYGAGWARFDPDADRPAADIVLRPEQVIRGRVFDVQGRPVQGLAVAVESMGTIAAGDPSADPEDLDGPYFFRDRSVELPAWPRPAITGADGRFSIRGAGRNLGVRLAIDDDRFARLSRTVATDPDATSAARELTIAVEPARIIRGRVTFADTGRPAAHALIGVSSQHEKYSAWDGEAETDDQGRYRVRSGAAPRYNLSAFPPERSAYLNVAQDFEWPRGALEHGVDLVLPRGVPVRGKVVEEGSGKPVAGARVGYVSNPDRDPQTGAWNTRAATAADGSFVLGVMPGPGYLTVLGPGEDYVYRELGQRMARAGAPGGRRMYAHAFHRLDPKPGRDLPEVAIAIRPAAPLHCRVVDPEGRPVREARAISRVILQPTWIAWLRWSVYYQGSVRDGSLAVHGLPEDGEAPVYLLDTAHDLGATVSLSARSRHDGPVTVKLRPCGTARARLVDPEGKPVARARDAYGAQMTMLVVTPGRPSFSQDPAELDRLEANEGFVAQIDPTHHKKGLFSDERGMLTLPALIPGATYRIYDGSAGEGGSPRLRKEFTVRPGETMELGDVRIERPKAS